MLKKNKYAMTLQMIQYPLYSAADEADHSSGGIGEGYISTKHGRAKAPQILDARDVGACTYVAT